jgi:hypothetical protein
MALFTVSTKHEGNDEVLAQRIAALFPGDHYEIGRGQWLVSFSGTAKDLYTKLDPQPGNYTFKGTVVFGIGGYFGVASRDMWEWIAAKLEQKNA